MSTGLAHQTRGVEEATFIRFDPHAHLRVLLSHVNRFLSNAYRSYDAQINVQKDDELGSSCELNQALA
jgi:hypothetical protein